MAFKVLYSPEAVDHLSMLPMADRALVVDQVEQQLTHQPTLPTRKRKVLRPNPIAPWELRLGDLRVFYDVQEEGDSTIQVKAVGKKIHNELWVGGERIEL
jgi:mRNA-degrading endonuclease RelE of RelBE toxin-antitoxin system